MRTVHKYPLAHLALQEVMVPRGAELLTVQTQGVQPWLWALVDPDAQPEPRSLRIAATGDPIAESSLRYVATFQVHGDQLEVFHVFEVLG